MKVYCEVPPDLSKAMGRVVAALKRDAPRGVEFVDRRDDAELVVLHVIGYPETEMAVGEILDRGQNYAIVQYCMRSTQRPNTRDWSRIWTGAKLVWSYYDLQEMVRQDVLASDNDRVFDFPFYCSPLGADSIFGATRPVEVKMYTMLTSGFVAESEGVAEVGEALRRIKGLHFHLGPKEVAPNADFWGIGISDPVLADIYSRCCWVAGLRRCEGFEMPAAEGLVCGARPIMFDAVHYRRWFDGLAQFVPEGSFDEVVDALVEIFNGGFKLVSEDERQIAINRFNWKTIVPGFWEGVL